MMRPRCPPDRLTARSTPSLIFLIPRKIRVQRCGEAPGGKTFCRGAHGYVLRRHEWTSGDGLVMAEQVPAVCDVLATIEGRDWPRLERLLDSNVHWTTATEEHLHGPAEVIALLTDDPPPAPPAFHEVRDGPIVRWIGYPGLSCWRRRVSPGRARSCAPGGPSPGPGGTPPPPKTPRPPRRRRRPGPSPAARRNRAGIPRPHASARCRCLRADSSRAQRGGTCSPASRPKRRSAHRRSHRRARQPGGQPANRRAGARRLRADRWCSRARSSPDPKDPGRHAPPRAGSDVSWPPWRSSRQCDKSLRTHGTSGRARLRG